MELTELLERVRKAEGPDRELDFWLTCLVQNGGRLGQFRSASAWVEAATHFGWNSPRFTSSIDAAVGLVERILSEANYYGADRDPGGWSAYVSRNNVPSGHWVFEAEHKTAPLAILAALLQALIAQQEQQP